MDVGSTRSSHRSTFDTCWLLYYDTAEMSSSILITAGHSVDLWTTRGIAIAGENSRVFLGRLPLTGIRN